MKTLKEYHIGKVHLLYIYTPYSFTPLRSKIDAKRPEYYTPNQVTVNDVIKSEYSYFYLPFNGTDKI